jgi:hypothetical protein
MDKAMDKASEFLNHARECRREAALVVNETSKEQWLKAAEQWERLARQAERIPEAFH